MNNITRTAMITICGRPNVGKSSLTNALVGATAAEGSQPCSGQMAALTPKPTKDRENTASSMDTSPS